MEPVPAEEIDSIARMMKIQVSDAGAHASRVRKMLDYFSILDGADVEHDQIRPAHVPLGALRPDEARPSPPPRILHNTRDGYVRAPKMSA